MAAMKTQATQVGKDTTEKLRETMASNDLAKKAKDAAYECGKDPIGEGSSRFSVKFYLVAMLFILFDIEVVFFLPWAITFRQLGIFGLVEMIVFIAILLVGYVYAWKKGALEWE